MTDYVFCGGGKRLAVRSLADYSLCGYYNEGISDGNITWHGVEI